MRSLSYKSDCAEIYLPRHQTLLKAKETTRFPHIEGNTAHSNFLYIAATKIIRILHWSPGRLTEDGELLIGGKLKWRYGMEVSPRPRGQEMGIAYRGFSCLSEEV